MSGYFYPEDRIAIVGVGGIFADAENVNAFWNNILEKKVSIRELPEEVVNTSIHYRPEAQKQIRKHDKTYTIVGSLVDPEPILAISKKYKVPPAVAEYMDMNQHAAIYCVDQALQSMGGKELPRDRTAVVLSTGNPAVFHEKTIERVFFHEVEAYFRNNPTLLEKLDPVELDRILQEISVQALKDNLPLTEDSATGFLPNLVPGRITNIFDFHGPAYTVDAACASSLAAVISSVQGLLRHEFDAVITGGIDFGLNAARLALFSAVNALSPNGSFPFDIRANGFVMGQGGGVIVMKRLADALRDKDNIIALISGYAGGSDGKGKYIAAPNEEGQARVIQIACQRAGYSVDTIELMEAHGTGTAVGDVVEVNALKKAFAALNGRRTNYCGLGSAKSNIGHLKAAAGTPAIIKASLALYHKTLPPTANIQQINPKLQLEGSPFYVLTEKMKWEENPAYPRRANVSSFGFGGADYHVAMEEYRPEFDRKVYPVPELQEIRSVMPETVGSAVRPEAILFSGDSWESISTQFRCFNENACHGSFWQQVCRHNAKVSAKQRMRLAICAASAEDLAEKWAMIDSYYRAGRKDAIEGLTLKNIYFSEEPAFNPKQTAFIFPGQASQYPNMGRDLPRVFPILSSFYTQVDTLWEAKRGYSVSSLLYGDDEVVLDAGLMNTKNTHPAIFLISAAIYRLLTEAGIKADYLMGHSLGEMTALFAAGMLDLPSALQLIEARGFSFDAVPEERRGKMMSIKADQGTVEKMIRESGLPLFIANINSPEQTVVGGAESAINRMGEILSNQKIIHTVLNVSHAFHTPMIEEAAEAFCQQISNLEFNPPQRKVVANHLKAFYPTTGKGLQTMAKILKDQMISPVRFAESVEELYNQGVRVFVEVGPSTVLSNLVQKILEGKDVRIVSTNLKKKDAVESFNQALAELFALGFDIHMVPIQNEYITPSIETRATNNAPALTREPTRTPRESLVYSGVSMGLPGSFKKLFDDGNFDFLCDGRNAIEMLTDSELNSMLELNITRLIKNEETSTFKRLSTINDVIRLAGKIGELNMSEDYLVDDRTLKQMTTNICAGVAAGYEALKDAGIPLVQEWVTTSSGAKMPGRLLLPKTMQEDTGIIFASCFTKIEPFVREVSKFIANKYGRKTQRELINFYEAIIQRISEPEVKRMLTDWFALHYSRLNETCGEDEIYEFNNDFMTQFSSLSNNRLAQFIGASGPNFQLSAACSSTAYAVTVAESLIRTGQARRMIIIGAENPTSKELLPWIGGGFLTSGAATNAVNPYEAAVPFDNRRNGMIMGAGAVGIVLEKEDDVTARGMNGICRLMGTHAFNLAGHQTRIDSKRFSVELDRFMARMEREYDLDRKTMAGRMLYFSHETFTPKKGGCSQTEKAALETAFGEKFLEILVTNTKGMTGHTIGASIEEAAAAKALQYQKIPPIVNYKEPDPELEGLRLSKGGTHSFDYALRMIAGFGGQGNYILMKKIASGDHRVIDHEKYRLWLEEAAGDKDVSLALQGRLLVAKRSEGEHRFVAATKPVKDILQQSNGKLENSSVTQRDTLDNEMKGSIIDQVLDVFAMVTKYPKEMLELNMEMEADLGIDTVKQATIFAMLSEKFQLEPAADMQLSDYPTIGHMLDLILGKVSGTSLRENTPEVAAAGYAYDTASSESDESSKIIDEVLMIISEVTKYPVDMLDLEMEMEADLGIDTVKQATIISFISEKYGISSEGGPNISALPTIRDIVNLVLDAEGEGSRPKKSHESQTPKVLTLSAEESAKSNQPLTKAESGKASAPSPLHQKPEAVDETILNIIAEITKYPMEMLEPEMEMEADLGIDTVKQATIFSMLSECFGLGEEQSVNISEYKTIGSVIGFVKERSAQSQTSERIPEERRENQGRLLSGEHKQKETNSPQNDLCYQVPVMVETQLPSKEYSLKGKTVWVIGSQRESVEKMAGFFSKAAKTVETYIFSESMDTKQLAADVQRLSEQPADLIVDCGDLGVAIEPKKLSENEEKRLLRLNGLSRFVFYRQLQDKLHEKPRIVCLVSLDGSMGYAKQPIKLHNVFSGALCGFYKGLRKEWKASSVKIIDLGVNAGDLLDHEWASLIIQEAETGGEDYELAYVGKTRMAVKLIDLDHQGISSVDLPEDPHFLITGGANGITAEIALGLALKFQGKYTLIGRTALPENIAEIAGYDEEQLAQQRHEIQNRLKRTEKKVTPIMVQTEFEKLVKAIAAYGIIQKIKEAGSQVCYVACDVRSGEDLRAAVEGAVKEFGPIHGVIHGAGLEKSHLLMDKSPAEFEEVFSVKAEGICNLLRYVDMAQLKLIVAFSSISGRFGNEAQLDYCAANSFLNSCIRMQKAENPNLHALSIAWSGWKDLGMAWRNDYVKNNSESLGVHLIEPERGVKAMLHVLENEYGHQEIVVSKGLKGLLGPQAFLSDVRKTPLIDWVTLKGKTIEKAYKIVSVKNDPIFDHHRLGKTPLVPAVGMMEICAEYHRLVFGQRENYCFRDLTILNPIKLFHDCPQEVFVEADSPQEPECLKLTLNSYFKPKIGESKQVTHCQVTVSDKMGDYRGMSALTEALDEVYTEIPYRDADTNPKWRFNNNIALGPLFIDEYGFQNNSLCYNANGIVYTYTISQEQISNKQYQLEHLLINPCLMDTIFQAAAIHSLTQHDRIHLPMNAEEIGVIRVPRQVEKLRIIARLSSYANECGTYNIIVLDSSDAICYYAKNVMVQRINR